MTVEYPVTTVTDTKVQLSGLYRTGRYTWQEIAEIYDIPKATIHAFATGRRSLPIKHYAKFGIEYSGQVGSLDGDIPDGTVSLGAMRCQCGQWFISNHPRRRKCFVCSPYRGRKR